MMNRNRHGWLVAVLVMAATTAARGEPGETGAIRVWPTAVVTEESVTLADIADLSACDPAVQQRVGAILLRSAPPPGGEVLISIGDIRAALSTAEMNLASINLLGSAKCRVSKPRPPRPPRVAGKPAPKHVGKAAAPPSIKLVDTGQARAEAKQVDRAVLAGTLEGTMREYIAARSPDPTAKVEIRFNAACAEVLKLSLEGREFRIRPANDRRLGFLSFDVEIVQPGQPARVEPVVAEAQLVKDVVVARRAINRGEVIEGPSLRVEERRFSDAESVGITELAAAVGQQCGDFVRQGDMLRPEMLKSKPLVQRGDMVTIWARLGGVEVKTTGKAQDAGALGETIAVCRDGAKRKQDLIEAMVTGPKTVTVSDGRRLAGR